MSDELSSDLDVHLRKLRSADTQAEAVAWMTAAYKLMERCIEELKDRPAQAVRERLVFVPEQPKLHVVQSISKFDLAEAQARRVDLRERSINRTVVYPQSFLHPGIKPAPKAWTHADTLRLERAAKLGRPAIQRKGR